MKTCCTCKKLMSLDNFCKNKNTKDGHNIKCRSCNKEYKKKYQQDNKEIIKKKHHNYHLKNLDSIKEKKRKYYLENREYTIEKSCKYQKENAKRVSKSHSKYYKNKRDTDKIFNLISKIRHRTCQIFRQKNFLKNKSFKDYIGCTVEQLVLHIESQFKDNMTWDKVINGLIHIDHIKPIHLANTEEEIYQLNHYTNLQPLWAKENLSKGGKYAGE